MSWIRRPVHTAGIQFSRGYATDDSQSLHTLRALLRECTYLPDPQAREYLSGHILLRYRAYKLKKRGEEDSAWQLRLKTQQQAARSALNQLRRANAGEWQPLLKALLLTYGRIGKRRWDLMRPLLPVEGQDGETAGEGLPSFTPQMHALLLSHARADLPSLTRASFTHKKLTPEIPEENSWLRLMPKSRVRNLTKRWYRDVLERVLPPLPKAEWERLRDLARGNLLLEDMIVKRRGRQEVEVEEREKSRMMLEAIVKGGRVPMEKAKRDTHAITPRFMRRLWAKVFVQCPMMEWDGEKRRWMVLWGERELGR